MPHFSIIIVSHNKPQLVKEAVQSVLEQTHGDWEAILVDSGVLLNQGFFDYIKDERFTVVSSGETPELAKSKTMATWCLNNILASGRVQGKLIMYLCDDDILYKEAFDTFWNYYSSHNEEPQAMYASQHIGLVDSTGRTRIIGKRIADRPAGRFCKGRRLDCQVDYLQFCHTKQILDKMAEVYKTSRLHSEEKSQADHADGIFMEQVGANTKVHNINIFVSMNRRTSASSYSGFSESRLGRLVIVLKAKLKGLRKRLSL